MVQVCQLCYWTLEDIRTPRPTVTPRSLLVAMRIYKMPATTASLLLRLLNLISLCPAIFHPSLRMMLTLSLKDTVEVRRARSRKLRVSRSKASIRYNFSTLKVLLLPVSLAHMRVHFLAQVPRGTEFISEHQKSPKPKVWGI